jgi:hypothetical protein
MKIAGADGRYHYMGKWWHIDPQKTVAPSGYHLWSVATNAYDYIDRISSTNGIGFPQYILLSDDWSIFLAWDQGDGFLAGCNNVGMPYDTQEVKRSLDLPPELVAKQERKKDAIQRKLEQARRRDFEARQKNEQELEKQRQVAQEEQQRQLWAKATRDYDENSALLAAQAQPTDRFVLKSFFLGMDGTHALGLYRSRVASVQAGRAVYEITGYSNDLSVVKKSTGDFDSDKTVLVIKEGRLCNTMFPSDVVRVLLGNVDAQGIVQALKTQRHLDFDFVVDVKAPYITSSALSAGLIAGEGLFDSALIANKANSFSGWRHIDDDGNESTVLDVGDGNAIIIMKTIDRIDN